MNGAQAVPARTVHVRDAEGLRRRFAYAVDYVLIDPEAHRLGRRAPVSLRMADHGLGRGPDGVRAVLAGHGLRADRLLLLAQPRIWGRAFNPVAFWLCLDAGGGLRAVLAEVTNTYGDRHAYLCHRGDRAPIGPEDLLEARKALHVSPFLPRDATHRFRFDIRPERLSIRIETITPEGRLTAVLAGPRHPLTARMRAALALRRPLAALRVRALIHWQALRLWRAGARFRHRPAPPDAPVTR